MTSNVRGALVCLALSLAGCTGLPTAHERQAIRDLQTVESAYVQENAATLPPLTEASTLQDVVQHALLANPRVIAAFHTWEGAVEAVTVARSLPDPMLSLGTEINRAMSVFTAALMTDPAAAWPGPGKLGLRAEVAFAASQQQRAVFEGEMLAAAMAVKRAWHQTWMVQEQVRLTRKALTLVEAMEVLASERLATGKVTQQDLIRAQMERDRLHTDLQDLEDALHPVQSRLRAALGWRREEVLPVLNVRLESTAIEVNETNLLQIGTARNPRLKQMRSEVEQALALWHLARKASMPDVSLGLGVRDTSPFTWMPSIGVTLPLWRDRIAAEIAQGQAGVDAARARLAAEELDLAVRYAETAFAARQIDRTVQLYRDRLLPKALTSFQAAQAGYANGVSTFLDLLEAERTLLESETALTTALGQREILLAEISLIILGQWPAGIPEILPPPAWGDDTNKGTSKNCFSGEDERVHCWQGGRPTGAGSDVIHH